MIDKEDLKEVCREFKLNVSEPVLDDLINYCDTDKDGLIDFLEFANFLNWKGKMPIDREEQSILTNGQFNVFTELLLSYFNPKSCFTGAFLALLHINVTVFKPYSASG